MLSLVFGLLAALVGVWWVYDNKLIIERQKVHHLEHELNWFQTRLFGSKENYERVKHNEETKPERIIEDQREFKVAKECADKGIPRSNKVYPSRFKGW